MQASAFTFPPEWQKCIVNGKTQISAQISSSGVHKMLQKWHASPWTFTWSLKSLDHLFKREYKDTVFCSYCAHKSVPCIQPNI